MPRHHLLPLLLATLWLAACGGTAPIATPPAQELGTMPNVRVGILVDTTFVDLSAPGGLAVMQGGSEVARAQPGQPIRITAGDAGRLAHAGQMTPGTTLTARALDGGSLMIGETEYRGSVLVNGAPGGRMTVINTLDMETYLLGVVPREIGRVGPDLLEAAKAQAVAARTYAVKYLGRREALGFDVFATVSDQVYGGVAAEHEPVSVAVRETSGEILTYDGAPIEAYYHSTCAGVTASIHEVWNTTPLPYLVAVADINPATGIAYDHFSNRFTWTERWPIDAFTEMLASTLADSLQGRDLGELLDLRVTKRTPSGRVAALEFVGTGATVTVGGDRTRWALRRDGGGILNSSKFDAYLDRDAEGRPTHAVATGGGWGHGIGMCQVGAMGRARAGIGYAEILAAYYTGTELTTLY